MANFYGNNDPNFFIGDTAADELYGGAGNDVLQGGVPVTTTGAGTAGSPLFYTGFAESGADYLEGGTGRDALYGANGDDLISGGDGDDSGAMQGVLAFWFTAGLFGGDGRDVLDGGRGNDLLDGGAGIDTLIGGDGDDTFLVDDAADLVIETPGFGIDTVLASVSYSLATHASVEVLRTNDDAGTLAINLTGNAFGQVLVGNDGRNILSGLDGRDNIFGLGGIDRLFGGVGNDALDGGTGADLLVGGLGADRIDTGGADGVRDTVRYTSLLESGTASFTRDQISGFVRGQDKIDLRPIDANPSLTGNQAFTVVSAFTSARGEVQLFESGADTIIRVDGDLDAAVDMTIRVIGVHLTASDLLL